MKNTQDLKSSGRFDFLGKAKLFTSISILLVIGTFVLLQVRGLNYGIDFAGGTEFQIQFEGEVTTDEVREFAEGLGLPNVGVVRFDEGNEFLIRFQERAGATAKETNDNLQEDIEKMRKGLTERFAEAQPQIRRIDTVGPQVGAELRRNGLLAAFYSLLVILIYVGLRFDYVYAPGAVFAIFHDAILVIGIFVILNKEINVQILAAILTLIGYSLNDTIVVYDRIRENRGIYRDRSLGWIINRSINDTLSRTIITSLTTFMTVVALYIFAGGVIQDLAFALGVGIVVGAYSTIYIASPAVQFFDRLQKKS